MRASSEPLPDVFHDTPLDIQPDEPRYRPRARSLKRSFSASHDTNSAAWQEARLLVSSTPPMADAVPLTARANHHQLVNVSPKSSTAPEDSLSCSVIIAKCDANGSRSRWHGGGEMDSDDESIYYSCYSSPSELNHEVQEAKRRAWEAWEALEDVPPPFDDTDSFPFFHESPQLIHSTRYFTDMELEMWKKSLDKTPVFRLAPFEVPLHPLTILVASSMPSTPNQDWTQKEPPQNNNGYFSSRP